MFITNDFALGKGLINAYKLESEMALFPRLIIDNSFFIGATEIASQNNKANIHINELIYSMRKLYCNDFDNYRFVDYLEIMKNYKEIEMASNANSSHSFQDILNDHAKYIKINLQNENRRIVQKYH